MAVLIAIETFVLALLAFIVVGLLRSHADVLRQLHELGAPLEPDTTNAPISLRPRGDAPRAGLGPAYDVAGAGLRDDAVLVPIVGVAHRTLLAFLSSGCLTCRGFWESLAGDADKLDLPADVRVVVVTKDAAEESISSLRELAAPDLAVVMSNDAWEQYTVPGSPYFVLVDGVEARIIGEGTGQSWQQVQSLLTHAAADEHDGRRPFNGAAATEARIDRELLVHGIRPGDPRLYNTADELDRTR